MEPLGYQEGFTELEPTLYRSTYFAGVKRFQVVYVMQHLTTVRLLDLFRATNMPIMFVVDSSLIDHLTINSDWLRALHALYWGRIYVWDGAGVLALHNDKGSKVIDQSEHITFKNIKMERMDSWFKGFPGIYDIAHFDDGPFWKGEQSKRKQERARDSKRANQNEQYWQDYYAQNANQNTDEAWGQRQSKKDDATRATYEAFKSAYENYKRAYGATQEHEPPPPRPRHEPGGDQWFVMMYKAGDLDGAKKVYRQLGLKYHPDVNKEPGATETMKAINVAYERVKEYFA